MKTRDPYVKHLLDLRRKAGISQEELARRAGVSSGAIGNWESGRNTATPALLDAALNVFGYKLEVVKMTRVEKERVKTQVEKE